MMDNVTKEILVKHNVDMADFQIKNGEWDVPNGDRVRAQIKKHIMVLKAIGFILPDDAKTQIEIEIFMLFEHYENVFVHEMGHDVRTHFTWWMRSDFLLDWMSNYFPKNTSELAMHYMEIRFEADGIKQGDLSDEELYNVLCDFFVETMMVKV